MIDKPTIVYTDGSCIGNPGPGGWGVVIESPGGTQELSGGATSTTNNRMELMAAIRALEELQPGLPVQVVTDSRYVMNGITSWMDNWRRRNWRTANGKPVKNQDLWQRLEQAAAKHDVTWQWVRGHTNDPGNERADALARAASEISRQ